jgi:hypothetical protein
MQNWLQDTERQTKQKNQHRKKKRLMDPIKNLGASPGAFDVYNLCVFIYLFLNLNHSLIEHTKPSYQNDIFSFM